LSCSSPFSLLTKVAPKAKGPLLLSLTIFTLASGLAFVIAAAVSLAFGSVAFMFTSSVSSLRASTLSLSSFTSTPYF
jgi:hypothetical protein